MTRSFLVLLVVLLLTTYCSDIDQPYSSSNSQSTEKSFHTAKSKAPEAGTIFLYPERIPLENGGIFNAERGMMFVPLNRSNPNSDVIAVEVYRFKASDKADPNTPPIFFLHGGPSFSGLERSLENRGTFEERWQPFLDVSDLVIVSQRGIGPSKPTTLIETTTPPQSLDQTYNEPKDIADFQEVLKLERKAWEDLGLDLSGFTVLEAAADVDDVRQALGYDKITLWGGSFGSHWGMVIMRNYPETVERAVLRGMEGPDHTYDHPGHIWNVYKRIAEEAEAMPEFAGMIPEGGLINALETVIRKVEEKPFSITVKNEETGESQDILFDGTSIRWLSRGFSGGLKSWPADVITLHKGNYEAAAEIMAKYFVNDGRSFRTASFWMLDCGSGITLARLEEYNADPALDIMGGMSWSYKNGCPVWDSDLGDDFRQNFETNIPTVIVHGTWDTSTPYENALELVPFFKNSKFIPVIRGPHSAIRAAFGASKVFEEALYNFAATGDMSQLPEQVEIPSGEWQVPSL
ncbi:MAG: alpha/beta hydrolase [Bacteroidota bacterium]